MNTERRVGFLEGIRNLIVASVLIVLYLMTILAYLAVFLWICLWDWCVNNTDRKDK